MLTVKCGMDPHMVSRDVGWFGDSSVVCIFQLELKYPCRIVRLELEILWRVI
jgi:hypothetical protein